MIRILRDFRDNQEGQGLAELALAIPLLLVVVLAIVDFGRAVNYWNDENHVANLGARYAALGSWPPAVGSSPTCPDNTTVPPTLAAYIKCEASLDSPGLANGSGTGTGVQGGGVQVCVSAQNTTVGSPVTVTVSSRYNWLPFLKIPAPATPNIVGTATMRLEQPLGPNVTTPPSTACP